MPNLTRRAVLTALAVLGVVAAGLAPVGGGVAPSAQASAPSAQASAPSVQAAVPAVHVAAPGDSWSSVAGRYGVPLKSLGSWNVTGLRLPLTPDALVRLDRPAVAPATFSVTVAPVTAAQLGASYRPGCPVGPGSLRQLTLTRWTPAGTSATGTLVVHADVVEATVQAFRSLYARRVPIARMVPVSEYGGSDDASMAANNTSAFNCRLKTGSTSSWSEHSYGRAVDVNPVQNPYVTPGGTVLPPAGTAHVDRSRHTAGMLHAGGAVQALKAAGFAWGGDWTSVKDYQHFSTTGR